jgi:hypothetical protein
MMSLLGSKQTDAPEAKRGVVVEKSKANIYTVMLGVALFAILLADIFLYLEWSSLQ